MHWNAEHAQPLSQWPEQHLDVSSTTSSPAHKSELYSSRAHGHGRGGAYSYAWANDDISALTASNLLKRYAEKYSGMLDSPYDRPAVGAYPESAVATATAFGSINGQKSELEPWSLSHTADASYPLVTTEGLSGPKVVTPASVGPPGGSSVNSSLSDSAYSGSSSCSGPHSNEYPATYNGTYLSSGYCPQPTSALPAPPPATLHALQPAPTLVPTYTSPTPVYNYPSGTYPHQASLTPSYSHPGGPYLPSGLAAPTPLPPRPTVVGGTYGYQGPSLGGPESGGGGSLKRKAFEMSLDEEDEVDASGAARYRKYGYDSLKSDDDAPFGIGDKTECPGNGFTSSDPQQQQNFKTNKPPSQGGLAGTEDMSKYSGLKPLLSPQYGTGGGDYSPPAAMTGENGGGGGGGGEQSFTQHRSGSMKRTTVASCSQTNNGGGGGGGGGQDVLKGVETRALELVTSELQDCGPALLWGELAGHVHLKAALEEEVLWPALRPNPGGPRPPRTMLLFGPRGGGKTTLVRSLASQLGVSLYRISGATLLGKWKAEAEQVLGTLLAVASARGPSLVYLSELEALEEADIGGGGGSGGNGSTSGGGVRGHLLAALEKAQHGPSPIPFYLVCSTRRPDLLKEPLLRCFAKRYHVGLPDASARRQVLLQALAAVQGCGLSEREMAAVLQRSEGFTVCQLLQLSQQAMASANAATGGSTAGLHSLATPLIPPAFKDFENAFCKVHSHSSSKELDTCMEWSKVYSH